jgi:hypothetical protein
MTASYTGIQIPQPGKSLQREHRVWRVFTDQHGRRFGAQAEMSNNQPIGEFQPQGFNPPWLPAMRFAKWREVGDLEFRWDYQTNATEWADGASEYYRDAINFAMEHNKPIPEPGGPVDRSIRVTPIGPPPLSPAIPLAAEMGDAWLLGTPGAPVNEMLRDILEQGRKAGGQDILDAVKEQLAGKWQVGTPAIATLPAKPQTVEKVKTIHDIDDPGELSDITWDEFRKVAKARGKMNITEISVAWAEFKNERAKSEAA